MKYTKHIMLASALFFAAAPLLAFDGQWFGTWILNRSLSHLTGPSITIIRVPKGYHFDFGAVSFDHR